MESNLRAQVLKSLPEELQDYVNSHYAPDSEQVSPTAAIIHELRFRRGIVMGHNTRGTRGCTMVKVIDYLDSHHVRRRRILMVPEDSKDSTSMREYLQNQIEQDRIAMEVEEAMIDPIAFIEFIEYANQCEQAEEEAKSMETFDDWRREQDAIDRASDWFYM